MSLPSQPRLAYIGLALCTIALGLTVHLRGAIIGPAVRDVAGDALWASMMAWWVGALAPATPVYRRAVVTLAICSAVELSQLYHTPALDAVRGTALGHLVLGSDFDPRDLVAYAVGVLVAVVLERALGVGRAAPRDPSGRAAQPHR